MIVTQFKCDQCGAIRQDSNHWFVVGQSNGGEMLLTNWNPNIAQHDEAQHICGAGCLLKVVDAWAAKGEGK